MKISIKKKTLRRIGYLVLLLIVIAIFFKFRGGKKMTKNRIAVFDTNQGQFKVELFEDTMPLTTSNFIGLVEKGTYEGVIFHRVIDGFMIQGGDPTGTGMGDPSIPEIKDEFTDNNRNDRGTISMANRGPNTGSSQFFINLVDNNHLDSKHSVFGKVVEGMDVVDKIGKVETGAGDKLGKVETGAGDKPLEDVVINKITLE
jgi:cyclophilin family peptidyl-prolyl cis-trans isomerase